MPGIDPRLLSGPDIRRGPLRRELRVERAGTAGLPAFTELPWGIPLERWQTPRPADVVRGIGRHVVRFVADGDTLFAVKELPEPLARREYRLLRALAEASVPAVEAVAVVTGRDAAGELDAALVTRYLEFSLPYRTLFGSRVEPELRDRLVDAMATLLVRLHVTGFWWGDCSLSNTLFRRDAGALEAYLVDAETAEMHAVLSDGQRRDDIDRACRNMVGELYDVAAERSDAAPATDPERLAAELHRRYTALYDELTHEESFPPDEAYRIEGRLRRLNELGFDAREVDLRRAGGTMRLRLDPRVVEPGHHARRLLALTGLRAHENQARRLLQDIDRFRAHLERTEGRAVGKPVATHRWLAEVFAPTLATVPPGLRGKREPAELFHEVLDHRWYMSERAGRDVGTPDAVRDYVRRILPRRPDEQTLLTSPDEGDPAVLD